LRAAARKEAPEVIGRAGLATDYVVSIDAEDGESGDNPTGDDEFDVFQTPTPTAAAGDSTVVKSDPTWPVIANSDGGQPQPDQS